MSEYFISSKKPDVLNLVSLDIRVNPARNSQIHPTQGYSSLFKTPRGGLSKRCFLPEKPVLLKWQIT